MVPHVSTVAEARAVVESCRYPSHDTHARMRDAYEATARAARAHGKSMGVGGVREDLEFQTWLLRLGMRYLTGGSDVGYILSAGRAPT
jgi:4-hydroxy-2-oxoheptanedioate aldolase